MNKRLALAVALPLLAVATVSWQTPAANAGEAAGSTARVRIQPTASSVDYDQRTFTVRVNVAGINHEGRVPYDDDLDGEPDRFERSPGMAAYELQFRFNPDVIEVVDTNAGRILRDAGRNPQCLEQSPRRGAFALTCVSLGGRSGVQGSGRLADVTLRPLANGQTYFVLDGILSGPLGDPIAASFEGGIVAVEGAPQTAPGADDPANNIPNDDDDSDNNNGDNDGNTGDGNTGNNNGDNDSNVPGGNNPDPPQTVDDSNPDDVSLPENSANPTSDNSAEGVDLDGDGVPDVPTAGTGYRPPQPTWPSTLAGALAASGLALLVVGVPVGLRRR